MIVKVCGVTTGYDAQLCVDCGADLLGVVLSASPRRTPLDELPGILKAAGTSCSVVGVFASPGDLVQFDAESHTELDYYQTYFDRSQVRVRPPRRAWVRAVRVKHETGSPETADITLLDFKDYPPDELLTEIQKHRHRIGDTTLLAGGLTVENIASILTVFRPFGVDIARGTESSVGRKDPQLVREFIARARRAAR